ncbi:unnamed protein product [Dovyalis caffra]|uniref:Disease resistance R13L4/SHOC-2-like LRR domain-containing protein n=1 Tax=Dovyalis caffra TaxID=77055 RepID=A0AAV1RSR4_9ROSI|nr:unnamed protein product [Dovyalis caffra]
MVDKLFRHKGHSHVPEFQSDEDAFMHMEKLLKKRGPNPLLLVLDDVWPHSEHFLDNFKFQIPGDKILVTSKSAFPRFGSSYELKPLSDEDAMTLFVHSALPTNRNSSFLDKSILNEIVNACRGNPLALTVVGRSLCEQPVAVWHDTFLELSKQGPVVEYNSALRNCLQQSLKLLKNNKATVKECFMDLGLFPEGQWIPATALIDLWVELYELDEDGVNSIAILRDLHALNLVNLEVRRTDANEIDGLYNDHFVMQHVLLRQLVNDESSLEPVEQRKRLIIEVSGNGFPNWGEEEEKPCVSARLLSITTEEILTPNLFDVQPPEVEVLVLNVFTKYCMLPEFMKKMEKLKALIITNYGFLPPEISNFLLLCSLPNLKSNTTIRLSSAMPNLLEISMDRCIDMKSLPIWFCDLVHLKKLSISSCWELSELPREIRKLVNLEVLRLRFCIQLAKLPETIGSLSKLRILDISDCASIMQLPNEIGDLYNLRKLYMKGSSISELPPSIANLNHLQNVMCDEETTTLWKPFLKNRTDLWIKAGQGGCIYLYYYFSLS